MLIFLIENTIKHLLINLTNSYLYHKILYIILNLKNKIILGQNKTHQATILNASDDGKLLHCLICDNFSSLELEPMLEHLEMDRSQISLGDIQVCL